MTLAPVSHWYGKSSTRIFDSRMQMASAPSELCEDCSGPKKQFGVSLMGTSLVSALFVTPAPPTGSRGIYPSDLTGGAENFPYDMHDPASTPTYAAFTDKHPWVD